MADSGRGETGMRIPRVFLSAECRLVGNDILISGADAGHLTRVLRLGAGARIDVLDGEGRVLRARIQKVTRDVVRALVEEVGKASSEPPVRLTLVQGLARGEKMDLVVQKAVEIGVARIVPVCCARTVVRLDQEQGRRRRERWQKIAVEAAEQCGRAVVPAVEPLSSLGDALSSIPPGTTVLLPWEGEHVVGLGDVLDAAPPAGEVFVFIGPEGGFTAEEVALCRVAGARSVTLGPRILRTETAGLVAAALVLYAWGDLGRTGRAVEVSSS